MLALDANAIIHTFQGKGEVGRRLAKVPPSRIAIPAIALFEVERGVLNSANGVRRREQLNDLVAVCRVLPFDERTAAIGARLLVDLKERGLKLGPMDTWIGATALAHGATLVTHNTPEFQLVAGLSLEDWY